MLFAESSEGGIAVLMALSTVVGVAITWLANYFTGRRKEKRAELKEDEKGIVEHQTGLIKRQGQEITELRGRADRQSDKTERLISHIGYLEGLMFAKGIKFQRYTDEPTGETVDHAVLESGIE